MKNSVSLQFFCFKYKKFATLSVDLLIGDSKVFIIILDKSIPSKNLCLIIFELKTPFFRSFPSLSSGHELSNDLIKEIVFLIIVNLTY